MNNTYPTKLVCFSLLFFAFFNLDINAQVGINTLSPGDGSILDVVSTDKGILIPRVDILDLATIAPITGVVGGAAELAAEGLLVYNTNSSTTEGYYYWDGTKWVKLAAGQSDDWTTTGNSGTTPAGNFIGTTDDVGFAFRTNNVERMRITEHQYTDGNGISWAYVGIGTQNPGEILDINGDLDIGGDFDDWDGNSENIKMRAQSESWFVGVKNDAVNDESDFFIGKTDDADDAPLRVSSDDYFISIGSDDDEPQDLVHITKDQEETTAIRIDNDHSRGFTALELWDGTSEKAFFRHDNRNNELEIGHFESGGQIDFYIAGSNEISITTGNVAVTGNLSKGGGSFKIDHPLDPENKYLYHSFVESPDMLNIYNGNITTDEKGLATIELPEYFSALNKDLKYQLSAVNSFSEVMVLEEVEDNKFMIKSELPNIKVSWQVTGVRQDPYANQNRIIPEVEKEEFAKGKYLHPEAYNLSKEQGILYSNKNEK